MADARQFDNEKVDGSVDANPSTAASLSLKQSIILVVTRNGCLTERVMDYAINVADRLMCRVLVAYVNTLPYLWDGGRRQRIFEKAIADSAAVFRAKASLRGVEVDYVQENGKIGKVISRLCRIVKRIEFVVIDKGIKIEEAASRAPVPVYNVAFNGSQITKAGPRSRHDTITKTTAEKRERSQRRSLAKTLILGVLLAALYFMLFSHADAIIKYWTMGGCYALLPVGTASVFFLIQASFISNCRSALGFEEKNSQRKKTLAKKNGADTFWKKQTSSRPQHTTRLL